MTVSVDVQASGGGMAGHRAIVVLFCLCAIMSLHACAKPQYIIPGLTLPPGAEIIKLHDIPPNELVGNKLRRISVWFNCPAGWDSVVAHVDQCMREAGYRDVTNEVIQQTQAARKEREIEEDDSSQNSPREHIESGSPEELQETADTVKYWNFYWKEGSEYQVVLSNAIGFATSPTAKVMFEGRDVTKYDYADYVISIYENDLDIFFSN